MPKPQAIQLNIAKPCNQSWDAMTPSHDGRFCNECSKTVIDFSGYSEAALYQFFAKNKTNVCGRFLSAQLNVPLPIPHQPHSRLYRICIALGLTLICTQTPGLLAQTRPPRIIQSALQPDFNNLILTGPTQGSLRGHISNMYKDPLTNVTVQLCQAGKVIDLSLTDYDGNYSISPLEPGYYDVRIFMSGYDSLVLNKVRITAVKTTVQDAVMDKYLNPADLMTGDVQVIDKKR